MPSDSRTITSSRPVKIKTLSNGTSTTSGNVGVSTRGNAPGSIGKS